MHRGVKPAMAVAATALMTLALTAGCTREESPPQASGPTDATARPTISAPPASPSPLPVAATATPADGQQLEVEINDLRVDSHGLAVLRFTLTNTGNEPFDVKALADPKRDPAVGFEHSTCRIAPSGVTLVDGEGQIRYHPVYRFDGGNRYCMNTRFSFREVNPVEQGRQLTLYTTYVLPDGIETVTVDIPGFEPVKNLPAQR